MSTDEQWLRETLSPPEVVVPADLAHRAERTARRIRRRRVFGLALAAAVVVAVPLAVRDTGPDPTPAATGGGCPPPTAAPAPRPVGTTAPTWPYRGDPALEGVARGSATGLTDVRPLLGAGLADGGVVTMAAGRNSTGWVLRYQVENSGTGLGVNAATVPLPVLDGGTQLSLIVQAGRPAAPGSALVVLGPPDADRIGYTGCTPDRRPVTLTAAGSWLTRDVGGAVGPGRLTVDAGGRPVYAGPARIPLGLPLPSWDVADPIPVPAGYRVRQVTDGPEVRQLVLVRCRGRSDTMATTVGDAEVPVRCDGLIQVAAETRGAVPVGTGPVDEYSAQVLVVVPG